MPTTDCIAQVELDFHENVPVVVRGDAPTTSSDGGVLLLRQADDRLGLTAAFAALLPDARSPLLTIHSRLEQVRQRVYQICLGYEDCNDARALRLDPALKLACDRAPDGDVHLSSQPTLSRYENAIGGSTIRALWNWLERSYVDGLPADTDLVVLDIDPTDDATHGHQQLSFFHGFYDQHMLHPLLVFDALSGQLVTALLRPGNAHAARGAKMALTRIIRLIKARFPRATVVVRGDSGFAMPRLLAALEALNQELGDIEYIIGMAKNPRLLRLAAPFLDEAARRFAQTREPARLFASVRYAAESWPYERNVIVKAEHLHKGANPRFVLTTLNEFPPELIYDRGYCPRGQCENFIKDFKNALSADRLSCPRFVANYFRLLTHAVAYRLMHSVRSAVRPFSAELGRAQFDTLRLRLFKVAALVTRSARRVLVRLPLAFPLAPVFFAVATALLRKPAPPAEAPS